MKGDKNGCKEAILEAGDDKGLRLGSDGRDPETLTANISRMWS